MDIVKVNTIDAESLQRQLNRVLHILWATVNLTSNRVYRKLACEKYLGTFSGALEPALVGLAIVFALGESG